MKAEDHIGTWTAQQLSDYVSGKLANAEAHRLERDMLEDPFLQEAVEGYEQLGQGPEMQQMDEKWNSRMSGIEKGTKGILGPIALGVVVLTVIGIGAVFVTQSEVKQMAEEVGHSMKKNALQAQVYEDSLVIMEIELAHIIIAEKEIRPEVTRNEQTAIKAQDEALLAMDDPQAPERITAPQSLEPLVYSAGGEKLPSKEIAEPQPEVFYLHDLKLADHRAIYEQERYIKGEWTTGTAARYERERKGITQIPSIEQINYEDVMSEAMVHFSARDYKSALLVLKRIEKRHSNDDNVDFYGGLCYYNLSKFAKADIYFRRALDHPGRVFDQEARWHLALSLIDQEKYERARYHLRIIVVEGEFYAAKAELMLAGIKKNH